MPKTFNPYRPPESQVEKSLDDTHMLYQHGKHFILHYDCSQLPGYCICCGQTSTSQRHKRSLVRTSPWGLIMLPLLLPILLLGVMGLIALLIFINLVFTRRRKILIGLCEKHQRRFVWCRAITWLSFLLTISTLIITITHNLSPDYAVYCFCLCIPLTIIAAVTFPVHLRTRQIQDKTWWWIKGAHKDFLKHLPYAS